VSYHDKNFEGRINDTMWNHSEDLFEQLWDGPWERYGLGEQSRNMASWKYSPFVSHTPDYRAALGAKTQPMLVEVQGSAGRYHKFKGKKLAALGKWNSIDEVTFWLWNEETKQPTWVSYAQIRLMTHRPGAEYTDTLFDGKRPGWRIPCEMVSEMADTDRLNDRYG